MPLRIRDYGEAHLKTDDDLFYFLQCATVATPKDPGWGDRAAEEVYALDRFAEYLRFLEKDEWFVLRATSASKTRWTGKVRRRGREWDVELVLKDAYPHVPPACRIPELMHYTDRKVDDASLGVGELVLFDYDTIEEANLNRLVYRTDQVGEKKVEAIRAHLRAANPDVRVTPHPFDVTDGEGLEALSAEVPRCDLVLGCVDSFAVRLFLNAKCVALRVPLIDGGASEDGINGSVHVVIPGKTACYRCNRPALRDPSAGRVTRRDDS